MQVLRAFKGLCDDETTHNDTPKLFEIIKLCMRCLEAEGNRLLIYRRKSIAGSNPAAYEYNQRL